METRFGIKSMLQMNKRLTPRRLEDLQKRLLEKVDWPIFRHRVDRPLRHGDPMDISANSLTLPKVDLYEGRLVQTRNRHRGLPVIASFNAAGGPILVKVTVDRRRRKLRIVVPEGAVEGVVTILLPIRKYFGPINRLCADESNRLAVQKFVGNLEHESDTCDCDATQTKWKDYCIQSEVYKKNIEHVSYARFFLGYFPIRCRTCYINCPHGAIQFDGVGDCYVIPEQCRGSRYTTSYSKTYMADGVELFERLNEESCWECFEGNEQYSNKCPQRRIRKVLHHNGRCCGSCEPRSCVMSLDIMELCSYDAISLGAGPPPFASSYLVDKEKCVGCRICYENINCKNNNLRNYTVSMVAHIGAPPTFSAQAPIAPGTTGHWVIRVGQGNILI